MDREFPQSYKVFEEAKDQLDRIEGQLHIVLGRLTAAETRIEEIDLYAKRALEHADAFLQAHTKAYH